MVPKLGYALAVLGGIVFLLGLLMLKFPNLFAMFGRLPGDINIDNRIFIPLGSSLVISIILTALSWVAGFLMKLFR